VQIVVEPPTDVTVWWYTPRKNNPQWYIQAIRPRRRGGEVGGVEYCILVHLCGAKSQPQSARYAVTPYCGFSIRHHAVFSSQQTAEAIRYTRLVAAMAYRRAIGPHGNLWWHQWSSHLNDKLEPFYAH